MYLSLPKIKFLAQATLQPATKRQIYSSLELFTGIEKQNFINSSLNFYSFEVLCKTYVAGMRVFRFPVSGFREPGFVGEIILFPTHNLRCPKLPEWRDWMDRVTSVSETIRYGQIGFSTVTL